jgi:hypothetical protein
MKRYRSEADFQRQVVRFLKSRDFFVQVNKSGKTNAGMPDLYWAGHSQCGWLELKLIKQKFMGTSKGIVWQLGQQVWQKYHNERCDNVRTLIAYTDCYIVLKCDRVYEDGEPLVTYDNYDTIAEAIFGNERWIRNT